MPIESYMEAIDERATAPWANLDRYAKWTPTFWTLKERASDVQIAICALGLTGEAGEAAEVIKKFLRDGELNKEKLAEELGDAMYYWALLCEFFELRPEDILKRNMKKLEDRYGAHRVSYTRRGR